MTGALETTHVKLFYICAAESSRINCLSMPAARTKNIMISTFAGKMKSIFKSCSLMLISFETISKCNFHHDHLQENKIYSSVDAVLFGNVFQIMLAPANFISDHFKV